MTGVQGDSSQMNIEHHSCHQRACVVGHGNAVSPVAAVSARGRVQLGVGPGTSSCVSPAVWGDCCNLNPGMQSVWLVPQKARDKKVI